MVTRIEQDAFQPLSPRHESASHPFVIHGRPGPQPSSLAVLVHGWGGDRYRTWGNLPALLFADLVSCDIGLYSYASGARRFARRSVSISLDLQAEHLAHAVRDLAYRTVVLVGHSMGGLLSSLAVVKLVDSQTRSAAGPAYAKLAGLFLCATPQAGTSKVPRWLGWMTKDFRFLHLHSNVAQAIARRFSDRITADGLDPSKVRLPVFALVAAADRVVDPFSASLALPSDRIKIVLKGHRGLVKPDTMTDEGYEWLRDRMVACLTSHEQVTTDEPPWPDHTPSEEAPITSESTTPPPAAERSRQHPPSSGTTVLFDVHAARDAYTAQEMTVHHHNRADTGVEGAE